MSSGTRVGMAGTATRGSINTTSQLIPAYLDILYYIFGGYLPADLQDRPPVSATVANDLVTQPWWIQSSGLDPKPESRHSVFSLLELSMKICTCNVMLGPPCS